jgi:hypothetical protein
MNDQNSRLPQLDGGLFLTDGGIETTLIFQDGFDLPFFAAFPLLRTGRPRSAAPLLPAPRLDRARARRRIRARERDLASER